MLNQHLIRKIIAGKWKSAYVVTAEDKVQRINNVSEIFVYDSEKDSIIERDWMVTTTTGESYGTGHFFDFGWTAGTLKAIKETDASKCGGTNYFAAYDIVYDQQSGGFHTEQIQKNGGTEADYTEAQSIFSELCRVLPEYYYLLEFCHVWGRCLWNDKEANFKFGCKSEKNYYLFSVDLLGQNGYNICLRCYRRHHGIKVNNIAWETDGDVDVLSELPSEVILPEKFDIENYMVDGEFDVGSFAEDVCSWLSDTYEFLIYGFDYDYEFA